LKASVPFVQETAVVASRHLFEPDWFREMLQHQVKDSTVPEVSQFALTLLKEEKNGTIND